MTRRIFITPKANQDLDDLFNYLSQNNPDAALRFFDATRQTITQLAQTPGIGSRYQLNNPRFATRSRTLLERVVQREFSTDTIGARIPSCRTHEYSDCLNSTFF